MSNLLIVESKNDKLFLEALIEHLNLSYIQVDEYPICYIDEFECSVWKFITVLTH